MEKISHHGLHPLLIAIALLECLEILTHPIFTRHSHTLPWGSTHRRARAYTDTK